MQEDTTANTLPVNGNTSMFTGAPLPRRAEGTDAQEDERQHEQLHILVVEDDPALATLEADILSVHGYAVSTAHYGELAITQLRRRLPDMVVLDLELTGTVNGWQVLQALRRFATTPVLITSSSAVAVRAYMRHHGETRFTLDHLPKPYSLQTLLKRVKRMLPVTHNRVLPGETPG